MANQRILEHFRSERQKLLEEAHSSDVFSSSSNIGTSRETFISKFLDRHLPRRFHTCKGEITDSQNHYSGEIDVIVYRDDFPAIEISPGSMIVLAETVAAAIEVKSNLTNEEFDKAIKTGRRVQSLQRNFGDAILSADLFSSIPYFIIGFEGMTSDTLRQRCESLPTIDASSQPPTVWAPKGVVNLHRDFGIFWRDARFPMPVPDNCLAALFLSIHREIGLVRLATPPLAQYFLEERT